MAIAPSSRARAAQATQRSLRTDKRRSWLWELEEFYERVFVMRER